MMVTSSVPNRRQTFDKSRHPPVIRNRRNAVTLNASPQEENNKEAAMIVIAVMAVFPSPSITGGDTNVRAGQAANGRWSR